MLTLAAFALALGLLIAVHELGHYRMALACGVKVLRFSIGFGKPLYRWQAKGSATEFVIGAFPLGGYVRMLDEREAAMTVGNFQKLCEVLKLDPATVVRNATRAVKQGAGIEPAQDGQ